MDNSVSSDEKQVFSHHQALADLWIKCRLMCRNVKNPPRLIRVNANHPSSGRDNRLSQPKLSQSA